MQPPYIPDIIKTLQTYLKAQEALKHVKIFSFKPVNLSELLAAQCAVAFEPYILIKGLFPKARIHGPKGVVFSKLELCIQVHIPKLKQPTHPDLQSLAYETSHCLHSNTLKVGEANIHTLLLEDEFWKSFQKSIVENSIELRFNLFVQEVSHA